ncbi:hypothetical protein Smar_0765 [Staphylothermus marinus F1]|uniref:Uncharacterized protein n=1 Tax=Staphylothermus marinus (strain ATCC 43588 / DSM 3639 / JCM 9404 / F1) TaxID=399550 RepID=A3DMK6_STAMF|nr:hypothetical protein [Staphylothermus marinus]ABN69866.1 hypothetical protein Smar_0765 [Staphylothermus marinus F1]
MRVGDAILLITGILGSVRGTTRLHKLVFLLAIEGKIDIGAEFIPYYYGPWSPDVQEAITSLIKEGLISVISENDQLRISRHI